MRSESVEGVLDVTLVRGRAAGPEVVPELLIEVPHGATRTRDFTALEAQLTSPLPDDLVDFFHVNTDTGAPELALGVALKFVDAAPEKAALVLRCRVPRTFIDCNRRIDAAPDEFKAGKVTPGLMPWITTAADRALLRARYDAYVAAVASAAEGVMAAGGRMLLLHTYAPREVGVEVDLDIVSSLRAAYAPGVVETWPLRPEVDVICRDLEGRLWVDERVIDALRAGMSAVGVTVAAGETYPLHPSTLAFGHAMRWPGRVLCVEVRRDLLAAPWDPFAEMAIGTAAVERLSAGLLAALG